MSNIFTFAYKESLEEKPLFIFPKLSRCLFLLNGITMWFVTRSLLPPLNPLLYNLRSIDSSLSTLKRF